MLQRPVIRCGATVGLLSLCLGSTAWAQSGAGLGPLKLPELPLAVETAPPPAVLATPELPPTPAAAPAPGQTPASGEAPAPAPAETPAQAEAPAQAETPAPAETPTPASATESVVSPAFVPSSGLDEPVARSRWASRQLPGADTADASGTTVVSGSGARNALEVGASLAGVIALIYVLRLLIRRARGGATKGRSLSGGRSPSGVASVLARYPVMRGQQVVLLGVGQRILVVHQSAGSMNTLSEITDPDEVADLHAQIAGVDRASVEQRFSSQLSRSLEQSPSDGALQPVGGLPGVVAETVDLTRSGKARRYSGGAA